MKLINPNKIKEQLNNCYDSYDPNWPTTIGQPTMMNSFKYYLERTAGLKLDFEIEINKRGQAGYKINSVEVVDESDFVVWMLRWT